MMKTLLSQGLRLLEVIVVVVVLGAFYFPRLDTVHFHPDESHWVATSCFFEALATPRFFRAPDWLPTTIVEKSSSTYAWSAHYWMLTQPPVTRYIIALGRIAGGYSVDDLNVPWDFHTTNARNMHMGAIPAPGLLWSARATMALLSVSSGLILFLLVRHCAGAIAGYSFVGLYVGSGYLLTHLRRAMSEGPLLFFTTLALLCAVRALSLAPRRLGGAVVWLLFMGVCAGLAGAVKLNGLALGFAAVALCFVVAFQHREGRVNRWRVIFLAALLVIVMTMGVFILVNPFLYVQPLFRTVEMILFRRWEMAEQARNLDWFIPDLPARWRIIPLRIFLDYPAVHSGLFNAALTALGLYVLLRGAWRWLRQKERMGGKRTINAGTGLAILAVAAVTALPPLLTPLDWDRYYMYPVLFVSISVAVGLGWLANRFVSSQ